MNNDLRHPLDFLKDGTDALLRNFHRAVFSIGRRVKPLDEEALLLYFEHRCAYCRQPFQQGRREFIDRIIPTHELGDPYALHNVVSSCSKCKSTRGTSRVETFLRQLLGPELELDSDEVEHRVRRIYDWISRYRPMSPEELFGPDAQAYRTQLEALRALEHGLVQLLANVESRLCVAPEMNQNANAGSVKLLEAYGLRKQRIAWVQERLSSKSGEPSGVPAVTQIPLGKHTGSQ